MSGVDVVPAVIGINAVKWKTDGCFPTTVWKGSTRSLRLNNITQEKYNPGSLFEKTCLDELLEINLLKPLAISMNYSLEAQKPKNVRCLFP